MVPFFLAVLGGAGAMELVHGVSPGDRIVLAGLGAEPLALASVGYVQGVGVGVGGAQDHPVTLAGTLTVPLYLLDARHQRLEVSARSPLVSWRSLHLDARLSLAEQSTASATLYGLALDTGSSLIGGWSGERGFAAIEATLQWTPAAWLSPTVAYRESSYADAQAGWYGNTAAYQILAVQGGYTFRERVEVGLRAGVDQTLAGGSRIAPVRLNLSVGWRL